MRRAGTFRSDRSNLLASSMTKGRRILKCSCFPTIKAPTKAPDSPIRKPIPHPSDAWFLHH